MSTTKQIAAARANGDPSKGPVSAHGKRSSSRNSLRHGLLARTVVLEEESTHRFRELLHALMDEFQPASATQIMLVETMAVARWRQLRIWGLQKVALGVCLAPGALALAAPETLSLFSTPILRWTNPVGRTQSDQFSGSAAGNFPRRALRGADPALL